MWYGKCQRASLSSVYRADNLSKVQRRIIKKTLSLEIVIYYGLFKECWEVCSGHMHSKDWRLQQEKFWLHTKKKKIKTRMETFGLGSPGLLWKCCLCIFSKPVRTVSWATWSNFGKQKCWTRWPPEVCSNLNYSVLRRLILGMCCK